MGPKILTVDDSKTIRMIVAKAFKSFDCEILEAANGVEGLAVAGREKPDVILLDFTMPIMDGLEMLAKVKADPELKAVPVVMLTAEAGRETVLKIAKLGVRDYLVKPFKEELVVERVSRVIDLKPKETAGKAKRFDDPLNFLVVDAKPAILEQMRAGLASTPWNVIACGQAGEAIDWCAQNAPDAVFISLSLPDNGAHSLFQLLRAGNKTKKVPIFGLSVRTAAEEQARAQQIGFTGIVTKPIDFEELKAKVSRALNLDTSFRYITLRQQTVVVALPPEFGPTVVNEVMLHLRPKITDAVDAGLDKLVVDFSRVEKADISLVKLGLTIIEHCRELALKYSIIGSKTVREECRNYEETKDWRFVSTFEEALATLGGNVAAAA
jgi:two-component system cell cycle response regulator